MPKMKTNSAASQARPRHRQGQADACRQRHAPQPGAQVGPQAPRAVRRRGHGPEPGQEDEEPARYVSCFEIEQDVNRKLRNRLWHVSSAQ